MEGNLTLVACGDFTACKKLRLRWRGPKRIVEALTNYAFKVKDLRNVVLEYRHAPRLKLYRNAFLDTKAAIPHVVASKIRMVVRGILE